MAMSRDHLGQWHDGNEQYWIPHEQMSVAAGECHASGWSDLSQSSRRKQIVLVHSTSTSTCDILLTWSAVMPIIECYWWWPCRCPVTSASSRSTAPPLEIAGSMRISHSYLQINKSRQLAPVRQQLNQIRQLAPVRQQLNQIKLIQLLTPPLESILWTPSHCTWIDHVHSDSQASIKSVLTFVRSRDQLRSAGRPLLQLIRHLWYRRQEEGGRVMHERSSTMNDPLFFFFNSLWQCIIPRAMQQMKQIKSYNNLSPWQIWHSH